MASELNFWVIPALGIRGKNFKLIIYILMIYQIKLQVTYHYNAHLKVFAENARLIIKTPVGAHDRSRSGENTL